jgi:hypothetical protein
MEIQTNQDPGQILPERVLRSQFAGIAGVSKQYISKLVSKGVLQVGADNKLDVKQSLRAMNISKDPARELPVAGILAAPSTESEAITPPPAAAVKDDSFYKARTDREKTQAAIAQLTLQEKLGKLVDRELLTRAMVDCGRKQGQQIDQITSWADEICSAYLAGGQDGVRKLLKEKTRKLRQSIADCMVVGQNESE